MGLGFFIQWFSTIGSIPLTGAMAMAALRTRTLRSSVLWLPSSSSSSIGSVISLRFRKRRDLPSGVWSPVIFKEPQKKEAISPEYLDHMLNNTCRTRIIFGIHEGTPLGALPTSYLMWLANKFRSDEINWRYWRDVAKEVLQERKSIHICKRKEAIEENIDRGNLEQALRDLKCLAKQVELPAGYARLIVRCGERRALEDGILVHNQMQWAGFARNSYLGDLLIEMYSKCDRLDLALAVFKDIPKKVVSSWTVMVKAYMHHGRYREALDLYKKIDVQADSTLLTAMFDCCASLQALEEGRVIHACLLSSEIRPEASLKSAIFNFYAKCGAVDVASKLFANLEKKNVSLWNVLIEAYVRVGQGRAALALYEKMDLPPNADTFVSVLGGCSSLQQVKAIHADIVGYKLGSDDRLREAIEKTYERLREEEQMQEQEQEQEKKIDQLG